MFDLMLKTGGKCLICRGTHEAGPDKCCEDALALALRFAEEYRCGLGDKYNFDVQISVRGSRIVFVGHPSRTPRLPKRSDVLVAQKR
jgi:hypothetical protein